MKHRRPSPFLKCLMTKWLLALTPAMMLCLPGTEAKGAIIGDYYFQDNFNNSAATPEALPALTRVGSNAGTTAYISGGGWTWNTTTAPGSGLNLAIGEVVEAYSLAIVFQLSNVINPAKVVAFGPLNTDLGLYVLEEALSLLAGGSESAVGADVSANTSTSIILTRAENGAVKIYQNGTESISVSDTLGSLMIQEQLNFFIDDTVTHGLEFSPDGGVSRLVLWNTTLTDEEVSEVFNAIPEPSVTALIAGLGFTGFAYTWARRKRR